MTKETSLPAKQRIWELDALRGLCILCMVAIHAFWDLSAFGGFTFDLPGWFLFCRQYGHILFILLSGLCATLASRSFQRGVYVFGAALVISYVTFFMVQVLNFPDDMLIWFGILHLLGVCMMLFPLFKRLPVWALAVLGVGAALLCTSAATLNACGQTLKEWAAQLLLPKAPKAGKRIFLERITPVWKRMKFTHKVTARNLFRYKKRFFMTVIGVAGCTALLVTGFGLKDSISDIVSKQFGKVFTYDFLVTLSKESALKDAGFQALMDAPEQVMSYLPVQQERISLDVDGQSYDVYLFVPEDEARLDNFIDLHERKSGAAVPLTDDGVVITEKFSDEAGLSPGDTLTLENGEGREGTFTVTGVAENYVENYVYMTPSVYEDAYGSALEYNSVLGILPDDAQDVDEAFSTSLLEVDGVAGLTQMSSMRSSLDDTIASINYVVYVIILCAGMLAFVVLYNLMNINITERTKEIATIKVLGFFEREVEAYVYRESNVLTVIGMLLGLVGGIFLHMFIMRTVEVDMVMFGRDIKPLSFVLSAVLTVVFSLLVNLGMKRKLRNISMVESMKAPE